MSETEQHDGGPTAEEVQAAHDLLEVTAILREDNPGSAATVARCALRLAERARRLGAGEGE